MRNGAIIQDFAEGEYAFRLGWSEIIELQDLTDSGPYNLLLRLQNGTWKVEDIAQTIRLALIGGDKSLNPVKAKKLVDRYVKERPVLENMALAQAIIAVALFGGENKEPIEEAKKKEKDGEETVLDKDGKMTFQHIYGMAAVMGMTPQDVDGMSIWQFRAAVEGYSKAHAPQDDSLSSAEKDELFAMVQEYS